ncbi:MAG: Na+/H+ antiporter NhaA [Paraprevotella sp.]|nr:Na+/H+ antiporter NhaA [Paraprevotella sp.]
MRHYTFLGMVRKYVNSSLILIIVTVLALIIANSGWGDAYRALWEKPVSFSIGHFNLFSHAKESLSLMDFINDFLMALFFFSVGLEIKREILVGELSTFRKALLPIIGACGGMALPVLIFFFICPDDPLMQSGMAVPMATDIAFSLGVLSLFGNRVPLGLKVFLATLAVADDLGGILVIAIFYSSELHYQYLLYTAVLVGILAYGNYRHVISKMFYVVIGVFVWYSVLNSGIHSTIAGVIVAFFVPARPGVSALHFVKYIRSKIRIFPIDEASTNARGTIILSNRQIGLLKNIEHASDRTISPLQDLEDALQNPINYFVIPAFAFANAGVHIEGISLDRLLEGVGLAAFLGLVIGKFIGVFSFSWLAIKLKLVQMPQGCNWKNFASVCVLTGIGFTVSMFIADLSYYDVGTDGNQLLNDAKLGILCGSVIAGLTGWILLSLTLPKENADVPTEERS